VTLWTCDVVKVVITVFSPEVCDALLLDIVVAGTTDDETMTSVPNAIGAEKVFDVLWVDTLIPCDDMELEVVVGGLFKPFGSTVTVSYTTPVTVNILCDVHAEADDEVENGVKVDGSDVS